MLLGCGRSHDEQFVLALQTLEAVSAPRKEGKAPRACSPVARPESNQRRLTRETAAQQMCKSVVSIRVVAAFARYLPGLSLIRFL